MSSAQPAVHVLWDVDDLGYRWPALRDGSGQLLEPFTSYLEHLVLSQRKLSSDPKGVRSLVDQATYALSALVSHLKAHRRRLYRMNDEWLDEIREEVLSDIRANPISRGGNHATKRTANRKLVNIYLFLYWCQKNRRIPANTIGWTNCPVRSSLPESETRGAREDFKGRRLYPKCYQRVGGSTRQDEGQYWATSEDLEKIENLFWEQHTYPIAIRNTLALRIQSYTGWRNESVNSLEIRQFTPEALKHKQTRAYCLISPPKQKLGYDKEFPMNWVLIDRIVEYINTERKEMMERAGIDERTAKGRLFIGIHGGSLTDAAYGDIFSDAFRAIGAPKGAGGHSIRRYRAVVETKSVVAQTKRAGLPVIRETIVRTIMQLLGHNTEEAGRAYDHVVAAVNYESLEAELMRRVQTAELQGDMLRSRLASLEGGAVVGRAALSASERAG